MVNYVRDPLCTINLFAIVFLSRIVVEILTINFTIICFKQESQIVPQSCSKCSFVMPMFCRS